MKPTYFHEFYLKESFQLLMGKSGEKVLCASGRGRKKIAILKNAQNILFLLTRTDLKEKYFAEPNNQMEFIRILSKCPFLPTWSIDSKR